MRSILSPERAISGYVVETGLAPSELPTDSGFVSGFVSGYRFSDTALLRNQMPL
jgi:hypothetical protein